MRTCGSGAEPIAMTRQRAYKGAVTPLRPVSRGPPSRLGHTIPPPSSKIFRAADQTHNAVLDIHEKPLAMSINILCNCHVAILSLDLQSPKGTPHRKVFVVSSRTLPFPPSRPNCFLTQRTKKTSQEWVCLRIQYTRTAGRRSSSRRACLDWTAKQFLLLPFFPIPFPVPCIKRP